MTAENINTSNGIGTDTITDSAEEALDARHQFVAALFEIHLYNSVRRALA